MIKKLKKVLVADDDLDVHQLLRDILQITFKQVKVVRALNGKNFLKKLKENKTEPFDLVIFNIRINGEKGAALLAAAKVEQPDIMKRLVLLANSPADPEIPPGPAIPMISKPYSLDSIGEVIKKVSSV